MSLEGSAQVLCGVGRTLLAARSAPKAQDGRVGTGPVAERRGRLPSGHSGEMNMDWIALALHIPAQCQGACVDPCMPERFTGCLVLLMYSCA